MTNRNIDARLNRGLEDMLKLTASMNEVASGRPFEPAFHAHLNGTLASDDVRPALDYGKFFAVACAAASVVREETAHA